MVEVETETAKQPTKSTIKVFVSKMVLVLFQEPLWILMLCLFGKSL